MSTAHNQTVQMQGGDQALVGLDASRRAAWAKYFELRRMLWRIDGVLDHAEDLLDRDHDIRPVVSAMKREVRTLAGSGFVDDLPPVPETKIEAYYGAHIDGRISAAEWARHCVCGRLENGEWLNPSGHAEGSR